MSETDIRNKVEESGLVQIDLETLIDIPLLQPFDLANYLYEGLVLREKPFREALNALDAENFFGQNVALHCSSDAILPLWSWMLAAMRLEDFKAHVHYGTPEEVSKNLYLRALDNINWSQYAQSRVIVKGCSENIPLAAYVVLVQKLKPLVKTLMFGEACSAVPLYKAPSKS